MAGAIDETSLGSKMGDWFRKVLCYGDVEKEEETKPALQISGPTDFRREDVTLPGLDPEHQRWVREKAIADAAKMYAHLQPLRSSPSGHFADPTNKLPSFEQFTQPRPAPKAPGSPLANSTCAGRRSSASEAIEKVRAHTRKISQGLVGRKEVGVGAAAPVPATTPTAAPPAQKQEAQVPQRKPLPEGKLSGESYSDLEDKDSAIGRGMDNRI